MNVLDSPVEALAFDYLGLGFLPLLNNLWTWLALLTAALSFWKIRSAGCPEPAPLDPTYDPIKESPDVVMPLTEPAAQNVVPSSINDGGADDVDGVRKGRFTAYYYKEEEEEEDEDTQCRGGESEGSLTACEEESEGCEAEWWERWERLLRLKNGVSENGWYTWQDLTEHNGNVVRLWDGGLRCRGIMVQLQL